MGVLNALETLTASQVLTELKKKNGKMYILTQEKLVVAIRCDSEVTVLVDELGQAICPIDLTLIPEYYSWKEFEQPILWRI